MRRHPLPLLLSLLLLGLSLPAWGGGSPDPLSSKAEAKLRRCQPIPVEGALTLSLAVRPEEILRIPLEENPSTGYQWELQIQGEECAKLLRSDFLPPMAPPPPPPSRKEGKHGERPRPPAQADEPPPSLVGAPGIRVFTIRGERSGTAILRFSCRRDWEKGAPASLLTLVLFVTEKD
ncbi:MAG: protease inhibitor I42 family protein [Oligosphaeraceae bacterium]